MITTINPNETRNTIVNQQSINIKSNKSTKRTHQVNAINQQSPSRNQLQSTVKPRPTTAKPNVQHNHKLQKYTSTVNLNSIVQTTSGNTPTKSKSTNPGNQVNYTQTTQTDLA